MSTLPDFVADLTPSERLDLIELLWESLDSIDLALTDRQRDELESRTAAMASGELSTVALEDALSKIRHGSSP